MADFIMPSLGADMKAGILVAWRVKPGDRVNHGDIIAEVETQKGLFEVEVFAAGVVDRLLVQPGPDKVPVGTVLATIADKAGAAAIKRPVDHA
ncbi:MAG: biotin/lipoyl-binding protein, partial [Gemmatimonadales bacterium]|nr:biotin/lipoyl-binding protein [Gemmatimonadales bacterium]